ncbi:MAG: HAD-IA family hydrolase [Candidatus Lokiarchaeota archaeon]|nr:HAD-IA family hydrolase [Candidatus Lokiarchaeota archaeon]
MNVNIKNQKILLSFDLDNTLINNREGIVNSFNYALKKYNIPTLEPSEIEKMIGTPLDDMFKEVANINPQDLSSAFREYYREKGIHQGSLLPGIIEALDLLKQSNFTLGVITSKRQELAVKITKILGIFKYFDYVIGESENVKSKLDPNLKKQLHNEYSEYKIVIIGDHPKDKELAESLNVPFIGVLTGNHSFEELRSGDAVKTLVVESVKDLFPNLIYSLF